MELCSSKCYTNQNVDRFTSKALEKFYATSGLLKNKTIQSAKFNLIKDTLKIDEDTLSKKHKC